MANDYDLQALQIQLEQAETVAISFTILTLMFLIAFIWMSKHATNLESKNQTLKAEVNNYTWLQEKYRTLLDKYDKLEVEYEAVCDKLRCAIQDANDILKEMEEEDES